MASSELTGLNRRYALRRIEAKFRHLGAAKARAEANRRYTHLHTLKHPINPDHLVPTSSSGGLLLAERYSLGRRPRTDR